MHKLTAKADLRPPENHARLADFLSSDDDYSASSQDTPVIPRLSLPMIDKPPKGAQSAHRINTSWIKAPRETTQLERETPAPQYAVNVPLRETVSEVDTLEQPAIRIVSPDLTTVEDSDQHIAVQAAQRQQLKQKQEDNERRLGWQDVQRFSQFVTPFKWRIALAFLLTVGIGLTALPMPFILRTLLDEVFHKHDVRLFLYMLASLFAIFLLEETLRYFTRNVLGALSRWANLNIIYRFYQHMLRLPLTFYDGQASTGQFLSRLNEVTSAQQTIIQVVIDTTVNSVLTMIYLGVLFLTDWHLTLAVLGIAPFYTAINLYFNRRTRQLSRNVLESYAVMNGTLYEGLSGLKTIKALAAEHRFGRMVKKLILRTNQLSAQRSIFQSKVNLLIGIVQAISIIAVLSYGGYLVITGTLTAGQLAAFVLVLHELAAPLSLLSSVNQQIQTAAVAVDRLFTILNHPQEADAEKGIELTTIRGHVTLQQVHFSYIPGIEVLHDINLDVSAGTTVAIVGRSGAGKTTLTNLLMRFYTPNQGSICIDGYDLRDLKIESLRQQFGVVLQDQDEALFSGTIEDNLTFGLLRKVSHAELVAAARDANILDFILDQPRGFKAVLKERGQNLSTGQRQRLAIAR